MRFSAVFGHQKHIWLSLCYHNTITPARQARIALTLGKLQIPTGEASFVLWLSINSPPALILSELLIGKPSPRSGNLAQYGSVAMLVMMLSAASMIAIW
jgi:hypothetical protein